MLLLTGFCALVFAFFLCVLVANLFILRSTKELIFTEADRVPGTQVALILGARVFSDGRLSLMLRDRVDAGIELYRQGKVQKLLMSGDNRESHYDEVTAMRAYAMRAGVASDDVVRDFAGFRTLDSVYRARDVWGLNELVIVTQDFHLPRALQIAKALGVKAYGFRADRSDYSSRARRHSYAREYLARPLALLDAYIFRTAPHFLGPREGLSGDAQEAEVSRQLRQRNS